MHFITLSLVAVLSLRTSIFVSVISSPWWNELKIHCQNKQSNGAGSVDRLQGKQKRIAMCLSRFNSLSSYSTEDLRAIVHDMDFEHK